jgi:hypothetical protein
MALLLAAAVFVLVTAASCCVVVAEAHNMLSLDPCIAMAFVALHVLVVTLGLVGPDPGWRPWAATTAVVAIPDPPPWR